MANALVDKSVNWPREVKLADGTYGRVLPSIVVHDRLRVATARDELPFSSDPKDWDKPGKQVTVWLHSDDGTISGDANGSRSIAGAWA